MLYTIGSRVKLKRTGDLATVSAILPGGLIEVRLEGGLGHIPVPPDAIGHPDDQEPDTERSGGARFVSGKNKPDQEIAANDLGMQYEILNPWGVQLCFDPVLKNDGSQPDRYRVYLVNDLRKSIIFSAKLLLGKQASWERVGQLSEHAFFELGDLRYDELNQAAAIDIEVREILEQGKGTGPSNQQLLRLKPKVFFKQLRTAPLLNRKVYHFTLFPDLVSTKKPLQEKQTDLRKYTEQQLKQQAKPSNQNRYYQGMDLAAKANFPRELDLHLDKLSGPVPKGKELTTQLHQLDRYLAKAIELGVEKVIIIHGKGTGTLRKAIADRLRKRTEVRDFSNGFLEKYDHGATEVFLD